MKSARNYRGSAMDFQWLSKYRSSLYMTISSFVIVAAVLAIVGISATIDRTPPATAEGVVHTLRAGGGR